MHITETITKKYRRARETVDECLPYPSRAHKVVNRTLSALALLISQLSYLRQGMAGYLTWMSVRFKRMSRSANTGSRNGL
jgi:hypothetical protein